MGEYGTERNKEEGECFRGNWMEGQQNGMLEFL